VLHGGGHHPEYCVVHIALLLETTSSGDNVARLIGFVPRSAAMLSAKGRFGPDRCLKYLSACVVQNSDMPLIELRGIDCDLGRNKLRLGNRAAVITAIQS
jgi:hypothetical protein